MQYTELADKKINLLIAYMEVFYDPYTMTYSKGKMFQRCNSAKNRNNLSF